MTQPLKDTIAVCILTLFMVGGACLLSYTFGPSMQQEPPLTPIKAFAPTTQPVIEACFTPGIECEYRIIREIDRAQSIIRLQAYSMTNKPITYALIEAQRRGVRVICVLDKSNRTARGSTGCLMDEQGCQVLIDDMHPIAHNKIIIIDESLVITGSYNFSKAANTNAENIVLIRDHNIINEYIANFHKHMEHGKRI